MGCLLWQRAVNSKGAPVAVIDGRTRLVRRVLFEREHGPIAPGIVLVSTCGVKRCVELSHLQPTAVEVARRRPRPRRPAAARRPPLEGSRL
jgi:hypothetical protein